MLKLAKFFLLIISFSTILFTAIFIWQKVSPLNIHMMYFLFFQCIVVIIFYTYNDYNIIKKLIPLYVSVLIAFLYPITMFFWHQGQITAFVWYLVIPSCIWVFTTKKQTIYFCIACIVLIISVVIIDNFIPDDLFPNIKTTMTMNIINLLTLFLGLALGILLGLKNMMETNVTQIKYIEKAKNTEDKFQTLFNDILKYFEQQKPYLSNDFTIFTLANELNTNHTYISQAINKNAKKNFNRFVNEYRIKEIKNRLNRGDYLKFTIETLYKEVGFNNQSTFNKVFKEINNITPIEYIEKLQQK